MPTQPLTRAITHSLTRKPTDPGVGGWTPATWFLASEQGIWLDPSDMATMFQDSAGTTPVTAVEQPVGLILDKSGRGNHATQATTAQKPVLSARKNLVTQTAGLNAAPWAGSSATVIANDTTPPTGLTGGSRLTRTTTGTSENVVPADLGARPAGQSMVFSVYAKAGSAGAMLYLRNLYVEGTLPSGVVRFNLATGALDLVGTAYTGNCGMESVGGGWYRCWIRGASITTPAANRIDIGITSSGTVGGTAGDFIYATGAQLEIAPALTRYQRVNTATDYDAEGFLHYFALDRVDDHVTAAAGGGGTTGICVCAAIRAGGAGNARTIWSDRGTNTGYRLSLNASNQLVLSAGNGTAHTEVVGPTITAGTDYVVTGWHDGTNLRVQVNAGAPTAAAFGTATAGTAGFTVGKDNGAATDYYGERIYEIVYRKDDASSADERSDLISYMAEQAGITL